jgi:hypothetical protein
MLALAFLASFVAPSGALGGQGQCAQVSGNRQIGMNITYGNVWGASASMSYVSESLCNENGHSYLSSSSSWTAIAGNCPTCDLTRDIYQIGILHCQHCQFSASYTYLVWAYGHQSSTACGAAVDPQAMAISVYSGGTSTYRIDRRLDSGGDLVYALLVNNYVYHQQAAATLDLCWPGGPAQAEFHDEAIQTTDQIGGTTASHQVWSTVQAEDGSYVWHAATWAADQHCSVYWQGSAGCAADHTIHNRFSSWDLAL